MSTQHEKTKEPSKSPKQQARDKERAVRKQLEQRENKKIRAAAKALRQKAPSAPAPPPRKSAVQDLIEAALYPEAKNRKQVDREFL